MAQANALLRKLPEELQRDVQDVNAITANRIASSASNMIPYGPAHRDVHLRDEITWSTSGKVGAVVKVSREAFYWKFLEFGTIKMRAFGFFRKAGAMWRDAHRRR